MVGQTFINQDMDEPTSDHVIGQKAAGKSSREKSHSFFRRFQEYANMNIGTQNDPALRRACSMTALEDISNHKIIHRKQHSRESSHSHRKHGERQRRTSESDHNHNHVQQTTDYNLDSRRHDYDQDSEDGFRTPKLRQNNVLANLKITGIENQTRIENQDFLSSRHSISSGMTDSKKDEMIFANGGVIGVKKRLIGARSDPDRSGSYDSDTGGSLYKPNSHNKTRRDVDGYSRSSIPRSQSLMELSHKGKMEISPSSDSQPRVRSNSMSRSDKPAYERYRFHRNTKERSSDRSTSHHTRYPTDKYTDEHVTSHRRNTDLNTDDGNSSSYLSAQNNHINLRRQKWKEHQKQQINNNSSSEKETDYPDDGKQSSWERMRKYDNVRRRSSHSSSEDTERSQSSLHIENKQSRFDTPVKKDRAKSAEYGSQKESIPKKQNQGSSHNRRSKRALPQLPTAVSTDVESRRKRISAAALERVQRGLHALRYEVKQELDTANSAKDNGSVMDDSIDNLKVSELDDSVSSVCSDKTSPDDTPVIDSKYLQQSVKGNENKRQVHIFSKDIHSNRKENLPSNDADSKRQIHAHSNDADSKRQIHAHSNDADSKRQIHAHSNDADSKRQIHAHSNDADSKRQIHAHSNDADSKRQIHAHSNDADSKRQIHAHSNDADSKKQIHAHSNDVDSKRQIHAHSNDADSKRQTHAHSNDADSKRQIHAHSNDADSKRQIHAPSNDVDSKRQIHAHSNDADIKFKPAINSQTKEINTGKDNKDKTITLSKLNALNKVEDLVTIEKLDLLPQCERNNDVVFQNISGKKLEATFSSVDHSVIHKPEPRRFSLNNKQYKDESNISKDDITKLIHDLRDAANKPIKSNESSSVSSSTSSSQKDKKSPGLQHTPTKDSTKTSSSANSSSTESTHLHNSSPQNIPAKQQTNGKCLNKITTSKSGRPPLYKIAQTCDIISITINNVKNGSLLSQYKLYEAPYCEGENANGQPYLIRPPVGRRQTIKAGGAFTPVTSFTPTQDEPPKAKTSLSLVAIETINSNSQSSNKNRICDGDFILEINGEYSVSMMVDEVEQVFTSLCDTVHMTIARPKQHPVNSSKAETNSNGKEYDKMKFKFDSMKDDADRNLDIIADLRCALKEKETHIRHVEEKFRTNYGYYARLESEIKEKDAKVMEWMLEVNKRDRDLSRLKVEMKHREDKISQLKKLLIQQTEVMQLQGVNGYSHDIDFEIDGEKVSAV